MDNCPNCGQKLLKAVNSDTGEVVDVRHFTSDCMRNLRAEIKRLNGEVDACHEIMQDVRDIANGALRTASNPSTKDAALLMAAKIGRLRAYVCHRANCEKARDTKSACTCGLDEVLGV